MNAYERDTVNTKKVICLVFAGMLELVRVHYVRLCLNAMLNHLLYSLFDHNRILLFCLSLCVFEAVCVILFLFILFFC